MTSRPMTVEEHAQGWCDLGCGKHAYVWRASVVRCLPPDAAELCTCDPDTNGVYAVKIEALKRLTVDVKRP